MDTQEAVAKILLSPNAWMIIIAVVFLCLVAFTLMRRGLIYISTDKIHIGADYREREIIRAQCEWAHTYIMGLYSKISQPESKYNGYFAKYVLETMYSEVVNWITFNHIRTDTEYITTKQSIIRHMVYSMDIDDQYKTKEFADQMNEWAEEVITTLIRIRENYK